MLANESLQVETSSGSSISFIRTQSILHYTYSCACQQPNIVMLYVVLVINYDFQLM